MFAHRRASSKKTAATGGPAHASRQQSAGPGDSKRKPKTKWNEKIRVKREVSELEALYRIEEKSAEDFKFSESAFAATQCNRLLC
jgi:hypothetical protein